MLIQRAWHMPSKNTFEIKPIKELLTKYLPEDSDRFVILNPFANSTYIQSNVITNDIDTSFNTHYNLDALDFLKLFEDNSVDVVLYDPPFSPRQVSECYKKLGMSVNMQTTQASYWSNQKKEIARIVKTGGVVITCGWNSGGIGKTNGFDISEILMVAHGGWHNDTIVTVETKVGSNEHKHRSTRDTQESTKQMA